MVRWFFCGAILLGCLCAPFENQGFGNNPDVCLAEDENCSSGVSDDLKMFDQSNEIFSPVPEQKYTTEKLTKYPESLDEAVTTEMVSSKKKSLLEGVLQQLTKKPPEFFEEFLERIEENPEDAFNITAYFVMDYRMVEIILRTAVLFAIESQVLIGLNALAAVSGMEFLAPYTPTVSRMVTQMISFGIVRPLFEWMGDHARFYAKNWITPPKDYEKDQPKLLSASV